jgi:hypothetical protein
MFTYRIYNDGGNLVVATYENNTLKGEGKFLPKGIVAVNGDTSTNITLKKVVDDTIIISNIGFTSIRDINNTQWGANRNTSVTNINAFILSSGGGNVISVNGQSGVVSLALGNLNNVSVSGATQGDVISYNSSGNWILNGGLQTLLAKIKTPTNQTIVEADTSNKITIDPTAQKIIVTTNGTTAATFGGSTALLPGLRVGPSGNTYDLPATRGNATGQVPIFDSSNNTTTFKELDLTQVTGNTDDITEGSNNLFNVNADWNVNDTTSGAYIANRPTIPAEYDNADVDTHLNTATATTGQVLSWSGTDYDWVNDQGGLPAGNSGEIQFNNAGSFGASSNLFYDAVNNRLGVGTNTPTEKLDIVGNLKITTATSGNTGLYLNCLGYNNGSGIIISNQVSTTTSPIFSASTSQGYGSIRLYYNTNKAYFGMRNQNNVGGENIYASMPDNRKAKWHIDVFDGTRDSSLFARSIWNGGRAGTFASYDATQTQDIFEVTNHDFSTKHLIVKADGNVGINTSTPTYKLDVNGTGNFEGNLRLGVGFQLHFNNNNVGLYRDSNTLRLGGFGGVELLASATNISGQSIRLKVFDTGNISINSTTDSGYKLDVNGTTRIQSDLTVTTTNATGDFATIDASNILRKRTAAQVLTDIGGQAALTNPITGTGASGQVAFWNASNTQTGDNGLFWDNTNKRLGIGTITPLSSLGVIGKIALNDGNSNLAIGDSALASLSTATNVIGIGINAGTNLSTSSTNVFIEHYGADTSPTRPEIPSIILTINFVSAV